MVKTTQSIENSTFVLSWDEFLLNPAPKQTGKLEAYCSSIICDKQKCKGNGVKVESDIRSDFCPQRGSALFWSRHIGPYKKNSFKGIRYHKDKMK